MTPNLSRGKRSRMPSMMSVATVSIGEGDRHEVDRAEVLGAAVEVGDEREAVLEVSRVDQLPAAADVEEDRETRLLGLRPDGKEAGVARRMGRRAGRRHEQRLRAAGDHLC